tara:strand:- start:293 stop:835 length:543 start_codon:yes stop_codon:yes gene_type:complete
MNMKTRDAVIQMVTESKLPISRVANLAGMVSNSIFRLKRDPNSKCRRYNVEKIAKICGFKVKWDAKQLDECTIIPINAHESEYSNNINGFAKEIEKVANIIADHKIKINSLKKTLDKKNKNKRALKAMKNMKWIKNADEQDVYDFFDLLEKSYTAYIQSSVEEKDTHYELNYKFYIHKKD